MAKLDATQALGRRTARTHPKAEQIRTAMQEEEQKQLKVLVPASLHARFKAKAATEGRTMNDVMTEMITAYVAR